MTTKTINLNAEGLSREVPIEFLAGEVISAQTRTSFETRQAKTIVTGLGKIQPGEMYSEAIDVTDCWLRLDDGKEMKLPFQPNLDMRAGHRVVFGYRREELAGQRDKLNLVYGHNRATGQTFSEPMHIARLADSHRILSWTLLATAIVGITLQSMYSEFSDVGWMGAVTTFFVVGVGMVIKRGLEVTNAGKRLMPEIEATAKGLI